jgi:uncharacterized repeat protein (TIGR03803 family)
MSKVRFFVSSAIVLLVASALALGQAKETVLYSFGTNANDGSTPNGGLAFDHAGNLYGTTQRGGANGGGIVFELTPTEGGGWSETVLYNFCALTNCVDGGLPLAGLVTDGLGNLYGTTITGGTYSGGTCGGGGCGTVFELSPPTQGGAWVETVLYNFKGNLNDDAALPIGRLNWDGAGNLYGTTESGGNSVSRGTVFELSPISGGGWSEKLLYVFCSNGPPCPDGIEPMAGVSFDESGNIYGTTYTGASDGKWGTVYELTSQGDGTWAETTLHRFTAKGAGMPISTVNFDDLGNLYGTASAGGQGCGGVWRLRPQGDGFKAGAALFDVTGSNGCTPVAGVFMDRKTHTTVGTASSGGAFGGGTIFEIGSRRRVAYDFCQQPKCADGSTPSGSFTVNGKTLYSTTSKGGAFNQGVVFAFTP